MKNIWLKFGCFLTGHNYQIMRSCSEASAKAVKKYTSAILLVSIIWGFVGYTFANRYLHLDIVGSVIASIVMIVMVVQIEKQIILSVGKNTAAKWFRILIAIVMAIIGSIIIDQIIFKDDVEIQKEKDIVAKVNSALPGKVQEINSEIHRLDSILVEKNAERTNLIEDVTANPILNLPAVETIKKPGKTSRIRVDEFGNKTTIEVDTIFTEQKYTSTSRENPKAELIPVIDSQIKEYSLKRDEYNEQKIGIRDQLEKQFRSKVGFLDELETMKEILFGSATAFVVWLLWFLFLGFIELFVVSAKIGTVTDYDMIILHQKDVKLDALKQLTFNAKP